MRTHLRIHLLLIVAIALSLPAYAGDKSYHGDGIDDVLRFVPIAGAVTLKACGVESASGWQRFAVNGVASVVISSGSAWIMKEAVSERRPDGTDHRSFPSGHTVLAFAGATILHKEFYHKSPWISVAGYSVATATAIDRVCRNRHHWYDAAAGAAVGIGGTMLGYWIGDKLTGSRSRYSVAVGPQTLAVVITL